MSGFFITFEGGEGAGKSTQARALTAALRALGKTVVLTREPGGSPGAESMRELLLFGDAPLSHRAQILAHMAARADHLDTLILPALKRGEIVICDRFHDSTMVYQGYGLASAAPDILAFIRAQRALLACEPDLTLLLEVPVDTGAERVRIRGGRADRYEAEARGFHERVASGFASLAEDFPERIARIDATRDEATVTSDVVATTLHRLPR
ncbi:dTMP kinase [Swaminathania salitolerans]|uniref:Thymidylate kinase n=1 Tax=Swaminathania salitolerans TaxID=182838 RepID=A0A511BVD5_9PROT|nr:dTMP kinase [Swaminathania salitolerans]GBQ14969.1 thymidylate kinase [Swaminathania salitolerans LMG 21291]GEL01948.1 thymidylate kinase [Swaminathania salitolerans]